MAKPKTRNTKKKKKEKKTIEDLTKKELQQWAALDQAANEQYLAGNYKDAFELTRKAMHIFPCSAIQWANLAIFNDKLGRRQEAISCAKRAIELDDQYFMTYTVLANIYTNMGDIESARRYGRIGLEIRDKLFGGPPPFPHDPPQTLPPPPSPETRDKNIIAFSLFGAKSKYCETAVLNALAQPEVYPNWTCRFYIDETVPVHVIRRFVLARAEVVVMKEDDMGRAWPGPMWRFLALKDDLHRVIFRDADSLLTEKDALAVDAWVKSGKLFHLMRDHGYHTELILAGLWGCITGALPPLSQLTDTFFSHPLESVHFADQYFLRQYVWPYARQSLLHHDSVFGFFNAQPFPLDMKSDWANTDFHAGLAEGLGTFTHPTSLPDGTPVYWTFFLVDGNERTPVCTYPGVVHNGVVSDNIPSRYSIMIQKGKAEIRLVSVPDATV
ncbi:tetratricopeptide repeat protein [Desulfosarcina sp. OttesenSCG-928-B08]|nr:tetratricopeptide repeat protein [Desulfosarcina sp. OttesenSCG-928-B08]